MYLCPHVEERYDVGDPGEEDHEQVADTQGHSQHHERVRTEGIHRVTVSTINAFALRGGGLLVSYMVSESNANGWDEIIYGRLICMILYSELSKSSYSY